ncbi:MAG TPA: Hsp70 family protein [Acidimicrobiales bacterium]|nr:Hsp70 family protein [Acidimicrobiales bacterium]
MGYHLGVDLGTTYTAAALARGDRAEPATLGTRSVSIPSVIYLGASGDELIGESAVRRAAAEPARVAREFKRRVGDPTPLLLGGSPVGAELLMGQLLAWVVRQVATTEGEPPASLAVTHPANWGEYKLDLLRQAVHHVGLEVDHFVPEPAAAASFYASQRDLAPGSVVAVYDLGGGTFDAAVVRVDDDGFHIVGRPDGIERMGGIDFDHAVFRHVVTSLGLDLDAVDGDEPAMAASLTQLRVDCVEAKEALSSESDVSIPVMLPTHHTEVRLTRQEFEAMVQPALNETIVALRRAVASAEVDVADLSAVLLVGGSSRIPLVAQLVTAELGRPIAIDARPKDAISLGAALLAAQKAPAAVAAPAATPAGATPAPSPSAPAPPAKPPLPPPPTAPPPPTPFVPPVYPPAVAQTPSGGAPASGAGFNRVWLVAAAAALVAVVAVAALIANTGGGGDDEANNGDPSSTTTDPGTTSSSTTDPTGTTLDPTDILGGIDIGTGTGEPQDPLPGDDWSDAARAQFLEDCQPGIEATAAITGADPATTCGCMYDGVSTSDVSFAEFNEFWVSDPVDSTSPAGVAFTNITIGCAGIAGGG